MNWSYFLTSFFLSVLLPNSVFAAGGERELILDKNFKAGFILWQPQPGKHVRYGEVRGRNQENLVWGLSQWSSKFPITSSLDGINSPDYLVLSNAAKVIRFGGSKAGGADLALGVNTLVEYGAKARVRSDPWVHLLVEQEFADPPFLTKLVSAQFHVEAKLLHSRNLHRNDFDPGVHAAQFQVFLTVQNRNKNSAGHGDLVWFGIPIYDNRHRQIPEFKARDFGGTEKYIFTPAGTTFTKASTHDHTWVVIDKNLLPLMREAIETAWKNGFLAASRNMEDYAIGGMNMGWELPGTFDVELEVRNLSLTVAAP